MTWTGLLHKEGGILVMCCGTETPSLIWLKGSVDVGTMFTYLLRGWCKLTREDNNKKKGPCSIKHACFFSFQFVTFVGFRSHVFLDWSD